MTLSEAQILALHQKLRDMRHDINGRLANITAAAELMRMRPEQQRAERLQLVLEEAFRAKDLLVAFSRKLESELGMKPQ